MTSFTQQQLHSAIAELDQALESHKQWYKGLLRILICHLPPKSEELMPSSHLYCGFGQWYDSVSTTLLRQHPSFLSLGQAHEKMHSCARTLVQLTSEGVTISTAQMDQFERAQDGIWLDIQALRHEFAKIMQNQDPLTGAQSRAGLLPWLREQLALSQRGEQDCVLAMLDLDHFKQVNDKYGHLAGDKVLISTVHCLQEILRPYDRIYRYGGEEFLLCMPNTTIEEARIVADRICQAVSAQRIPLGNDGETLQVTASLGVAMLDSSRSVEDAIDCADQAMYAAKKAGRNCVVTEAQALP